MWAKASIFRIGPFWPPRRTRILVVDDGRVLTLDEPAIIDQALALADKLGGAANLQHQRDATTQTSGTLLSWTNSSNAACAAGAIGFVTPSRARLEPHASVCGAGSADAACEVPLPHAPAIRVS
jgi:hypothetical protein